MRTQRERLRAMRLMLLLLAGALLLNGCSAFLPDEKHPSRVCSAPDTIYADNGSGVVVGIAQVCWTEWRAPAPDSADVP